MSALNASQLRWSYFSTFSTAALQMVAAITITRFLQPRDYGLAAMAMLSYSLVGYFTQLGVSRVIVQKTDLTEGNIRAAFGLSLATGLGGFVILALLSPLLAWYFHESRLTPVILAFGLNLIFLSLGMVASGLLRREFRIRALAICDVLGYLLSTFGLGLPLAMHGFGVWALVGSNVSQPLIATIAYFIARPHSVVPSRHRADYRHVFGYSAKASVTTTVEALGGSMDTLVMGRMLQPSALGMYNRSLTLSTLPSLNLSMGLTRVFQPTIARAADRGREECLHIYLAAERQLMSLIFPFCAGAAVAAPVIIPVLFGRQWTPAVPVYEVLCLVAALDASFHLPAIQLEILSLFRHKFMLQTAFAVCFGVGIAVAAPHGGTLAVAWVYAALQAVRTLGLHVLSARSMRTGLGHLLRSWVPGLLCAAFVAAILAGAQHSRLHTLLPWPALQLALLVALSGAALAGFYRVFYRATVYESWRSLLRRQE
ncbi:MAG: lipopolysaccharide biosynthesis protein [Acidobacteriota bacterium]|nr:lipopolysaccharide biosynthesis protein [Acidobacteriota bacterium]